jgi:hypothetical protein
MAIAGQPRRTQIQTQKTDEEIYCPEYREREQGDGGGNETAPTPIMVTLRN